MKLTDGKEVNPESSEIDNINEFIAPVTDMQEFLDTSYQGDKHL